MSTAQQELSIVGQQSVITPPAQPKPTDLRHFSMMMPVEEQQHVLAEFKERRDNFRDWLRSQLVEGIHYGYPPGCEPKYDDHGNVLVWMKNGYKPFPKEQWTPKPSFYLAGADFVCDLLGLKPEYAADKAAWEQMGSPVNTFVFACYLKSRANGETVGEGRGVRQVGQKGGDANNAIKMAMKSSKVAAVLDTYGLRDAFTQDLEDAKRPPPEHDNPAHDATAPRATPRSERVTAEHINELIGLWKAYVNPDGNKKDFADYCRGVCQTTVTFEKLSAWESWQVAKVKETLEQAGR